MDAQTAPQVTTHRKGGNPNWKPGKSGNPSGKTRAMRYLESFAAEFEARHGRKPNTIERVTLSNAAALAVKADGRGSRRVGVEHIVRCGRLLQSLLDGLGLAPAKPAPPAPKTPRQVLEEECARINGGSK
jgi:hypothetical protein